MLFVVPVVLLLFTLISFCGRVRLQHPFSESFHNVRLDVWLSPCKKKMLFFFLGFPVSPSLSLFALLGVYHFLGKVGLLKACDRCLWFFNEIFSHAIKRERKNLFFFRVNGDQSFIMY